ncbi:MAG: hypothetical protein M1617_06620 [Actinobacteria bacterium]|nr:hypothetical protein [Actinomycetota bacterium]MCL5887942.1 hypothetical protein [Actinomycetota bacterium]
MRKLCLHRDWDYILLIVTVVLLVGLGLQSFIGTGYVWWAQANIPNFMAGAYADYINVMNWIAAPMLILLVVAMGLCVPKRMFERTALLIVSGVMLLAGVVAWIATGSLAMGVTAYMVLAGLIQVAVVVKMIAGGRAPSYFTKGRIIKIGSGLLHLGFILFAIVCAALQDSAIMLPVFWTSTFLMGIGCIMTFYADTFAQKRKIEVETETAF